MSKNKIIFAILWWVLLILLLIWVSALNWWTKKPTKSSWSSNLSIWVVGDETAWYSSIISGFKQRYPEYAKANIKFTKFSSYEDYEKTLIKVMADWNSPDIFVVNNNWWWFLEWKTQAIPNSVINTEDFQSKFLKAFDDFVIKRKESNEEWKEIINTYLKWVPLWYETLWVFYNWKLTKDVPLTWSDLENEIQSWSWNSDYATIALWLWWKYIIGAWDIFSVLLLQNWIESYKNLANNKALATLKAYESYSIDESNDLTKFIDEMDNLNLTTVDMFARWKIWMIIGYPSLLKEIELAIKRTAWNAKINDKFLRSSILPQIWSSSEEKNEVNLINYNYFALSKLSKNKEISYTFLNYLTRQEAQEKYLKSFPYYLPTLKSLEDSRLQEELSKNYDRVKYSSFLNDKVVLKNFDKWLKVEYDMFFNKNLWNSSDSWSESISPSSKKNNNILQKWIDYIECNKNHLINLTWFDQECN